MRNAIDINQFLVDEVHQTDQALPFLVETVAGSVNGVSKLLLQEAINQRVGLYCMSLSSTTFGLFDTKQNKKYLFEFELLGGTLRMNQRRAQLDEIKFFLHRIDQLAQLTVECEHLLGQYTNHAVHSHHEPLPQLLLEQLAVVFKFKLPMAWQQLSSQQLNGMVGLLNAIGQKCQRLLESSTESPKKSGLFNYVEGLIASQSLTKDDCVLVTNRAKQNPEKNIIYSLYIYTSVVYINHEKDAEQSSLKVDVNSYLVTLDDVALPDLAMDWVMDMFLRISADLKKGIAMVYEST